MRSLQGNIRNIIQAMDLNGDDRSDISGAIAELGYSFLGGIPPPRGVGCQVYATCGTSPGCE